MPDPRFFAVAGPFTLAEIAQVAGAQLTAGADPGKTAHRRSTAQPRHT